MCLYYKENEIDIHVRIPKMILIHENQRLSWISGQGLVARNTVFTSPRTSDGSFRAFDTALTTAYNIPSSYNIVKQGSMMNREKFPRLSVDDTSFVIKDGRGRRSANQDFFNGFLLPNSTANGLMLVLNISLIVVIPAPR